MPPERSQAAATLQKAERLRRRYLGPFLAALLAARALGDLAWLGFTLPVKSDLAYPEAAIVARAWDVARGRTPYTDWRLWPHAFAPYAPLTYYSVGWIACALDGGETSRTVYRIGRGFSLLCLAAGALLAGAMAARLGGGLPAAGLAAALALAWEPLFAHLAAYGPNGPHVVFALLAVGVALGGPARRWRLAVAWLALSISFWFKPFSFGVAAALVVWTWQGLGRRVATAFLAAGLAAHVGLFLTLNAAWGGSLGLNLVGAVDTGLDAANLVRFIRSLPLIPALVLATGLALAVRNLCAVSARAPAFVVSLALVASFAMAGAASFKAGAFASYFLEAYLISAALVADGVRCLWRRAPGDGYRRAAWAEPALLLGFAPVVLIDTVPALMSLRDDLERVRAQWSPTSLERRLTEAEGPALSVIPYFGLAAAGGEPTLLDPFQYRALVRRGWLEAGPLLERIQERHFGTILIEGELDGLGERYFTPEIARAIAREYVVAERYGRLVWLRPRAAND